MIGGGFVQHAVDTNRRDKAQKAARREKFNGNYSDQAILGKGHASQLDFSHLSPAQIAAERKRIQERYTKQKRRQIVVALVAIVIVLGLFVYLYSLL